MEYQRKRPLLHGNTLLRNAGIPFGLYFLMIFVVDLFWRTNKILLFVLVGLSAITYLLYMKLSKYQLLLYVLASTFSTIAECILSYNGFWSYANPSALGIPLWMPMVWPNLVLLSGQVAFSLSEALSVDEILSLVAVVFCSFIIILYGLITFILIERLIALVFIVLTVAVILFSRSRLSILIFVTSGIMGSFMFLVWIVSGVLRYDTQWFYSHIIPIPLSLPYVCGISANVVLVASDMATIFQETYDQYETSKSFGEIASLTVRKAFMGEAARKKRFE